MVHFLINYHLMKMNIIVQSVQQFNTLICNNNWSLSKRNWTKMVSIYEKLSLIFSHEWVVCKHKRTHFSNAIKSPLHSMFHRYILRLQFPCAPLEIIKDNVTIISYSTFFLFRIQITRFNFWRGFDVDITCNIHKSDIQWKNSYVSLL